jgi:hypothetical protein
VAPTAVPARGDGPPQTCPNPTAVTPQINPDTGLRCHESRCTPGLCAREDIAPLSALPKLQDRLILIDCSPHTYPPLQIFAEAGPNRGLSGRSRLFQYYLLDSTGFEPSVFTTKIANVNDDPSTMRTVWGANCDLPTIGSVRLALEPKPDKPTDPDDPRAFIDIFTDIRGLFVINNESGWYEGWMIHDLEVVDVDPSPVNGHPAFGKITAADAAFLAGMGTLTHNNAVPGNTFTVDGEAPHFPRPADRFPDQVTNVVPLQLSMGAYNALQQSDAHSYWEFNYTTNWIHPLYELPFAGGFPDHAATDPADTFENGEIGLGQSIVPGNAINENRDMQKAVTFGDNPGRPRDPDLFDSNVDAQREFRQRFIPSGLAREVFLNVYERRASFEPDQPDLEQRLIDGYKAAVALIDQNGDGIISAAEGDIDTCNKVCPINALTNPDCSSNGQGDNQCIYLLPRSYKRFAVTREINDGLLAPRFAPSTRGWALSGDIVTGFPVVEASQGRDSDDR